MFVYFYKYEILHFQKVENVKDLKMKAIYMYNNNISVKKYTKKMFNFLLSFCALYDQY